MNSNLSRRFSRLYCIWLFTVVTLLLNSRLAVADAGTFAGEWISRTIEGAGSPNNDPACAALTWTDRKISLEPIPGKSNRFRGEWVRKYQSLWMSVHGETCRFPGEATFVDTHLGVLGWGLSGVYDPKTDTIHFSGTYHDCNGNVCPQMQVFAKNFNTDLRIIEEDLVDVDPTLGIADQHHFVSVLSEGKHVDEMMRGLKIILDLVDRGDFNAVYQHSDTASQKAITMDQFKANCKVLRDRTGPIVSRSSMNTFYVNYSPLSKNPGQYAIVMNVVYFPRNARTIEYILMTTELADWKLSYYYLGGSTTGDPNTR